MPIQTRLLVATAFAALAASPVSAQQDAEPAPVAFGQYSVRAADRVGGVTVSEANGQAELVVARASAILEGVEFTEGVIEFDLGLEDDFGFVGVMWHSDGEPAGSGTYEYFYLRQHKSGMPDAGQYTPARGGLTSWQVYSDANAIAPFAFTHEGWNRLKIVVEDDRADIFLNGSTLPVLHVPDLATDRGSGTIGFRSSGPNGRLRIANLTIRPLGAGEGVVGTPRQVAAVPAGVIDLWQVSQPFDEKRVGGALSLPADVAALPALGALAAGTRGIADIGRLVQPEEGADTVLVSTRILAQAGTRARMRFGYSDRLRLFLNGELVFDGVAGWRSRDFFYLGTVGFEDAVVLDLNPGENVLTAAVSETFGGWAFAAAIEAREGLAITP